MLTEGRFGLMGGQLLSKEVWDDGEGRRSRHTVVHKLVNIVIYTVQCRYA